MRATQSVRKGQDWHSCTHRSLCVMFQTICPTAPSWAEFVHHSSNSSRQNRLAACMSPVYIIGCCSWYRSKNKTPPAVPVCCKNHMDANGKSESNGFKRLMLFSPKVPVILSWLNFASKLRVDLQPYFSSALNTPARCAGKAFQKYCLSIKFFQSKIKPAQLPVESLLFQFSGFVSHWVGRARGKAMVLRH